MSQVTFGYCLVNSSASCWGTGKPVSKVALSTTGSVPQFGPVGRGSGVAVTTIGATVSLTMTVACTTTVACFSTTLVTTTFSGVGPAAGAHALNAMSATNRTDTTNHNVFFLDFMMRSSL